MRRLHMRLLAICAMLGSMGMTSKSSADPKPPSPPGLKVPDTLDLSAKPTADLGRRQTALATWYGRVLHGHHTASGERFDMHKFTAAHPYLPFGTRLRVTNLRTSRSVVVRINDRGPLKPGWALDLSYAAAKQINMIRSGVEPVRMEILESQPAVAGLRAAIR